MYNNQKNIVITGCSSGIGKQLAHDLHQRGYRVIASCRRQEDVDELLTHGVEALLLDLTNPESIKQAVAHITVLSGSKIYALINNGAYGQPGAVIDLSRNILREQFETNVFGTQQLTNEILKIMLPHKQGRIIQISSVLGFVCLKFRGAYNASKYALEALTDTMRLEHYDHGIQFSLIQPGPIESKFRDNAHSMYIRNIDQNRSVFRETYASVEKRLRSSENAKFTLPPSAVSKSVIHALESKRAKIRYRVTTPTHIMAILKIILPTRWFDKFLRANSE